VNEAGMLWNAVCDTRRAGGVKLCGFHAGGQHMVPALGAAGKRMPVQEARRNSLDCVDDADIMDL